MHLALYSDTYRPADGGFDELYFFFFLTKLNISIFFLKVASTVKTQSNFKIMKN